MVQREEFYYDSRDNKSRIHAVRWTPETEKPTFILQLVHGMAEYALRYDDFARFIAEKGAVVVADDHLGHGESVGENGIQGYFCENDPATVVVRDVHRLKKMTQEKYPGVPYYILGHSMGSFILRNYLCKYGTGIDGAIVMGTGNQPKLLAMMGKLIPSIIAKFKGWEYKSKFVDNMALGANNKKIANKRTPVDWLSRNTENVDNYIADPQCGFLFTVNGFYTLCELVLRASAEENLKQMPKTLPVFFVAGKEDPVGNYGKGVQAVCNRFLTLGMNRIEIKLYEEDRHEILNEVDNKTVYEDIYKWIQEQLRNE